ncbi:MAG: DUF3990 domain-containing protein [Bacteroidales bacterium]|jgi:hypothetical protein|nr:DUF3990 domain-containing protein [Bacteroidales bacterium]
MKIYHGTNIEFGAIDLSFCPPNRDFGQGFYTTSIEAHAIRRAQEMVRKLKKGTVTILEYNFDFDEITKTNPNLKIKRFENVCAEWAQFVMFNRLRKENEPQHEYDIVEGPVANDKMFRQFQLYANNKIKMNEFIRRIKFREATHQIAFCTETSLDALLDYNEPPRYKIEALVAELTVKLMQDRNISKIDAMTIIYHSDVFAKISDEKTSLYLKPWQEIYEILKMESSNS